MMRHLVHDNGAGLSDRDGQALEQAAMKQEDVIRAFFAARPGRHFTPWEVYHAFDEDYFIQSIRRAITDLTEEGVLVKCPDIKKPGDGGVDCNTWTVNIGQVDLFGMRRGPGYGDAT